MTDPLLIQAIRDLTTAVVNIKHGGTRLDYDDVQAKLTEIASVAPSSSSHDILAAAINGLNETGKAQAEWFKSHLDCATKQDLKEMENRIMEAIDKFAAAVNTAFDSLGSAADSLVTAVDATNKALTGVAGDVQFLKDEITKLQNSPGTFTPADQGTLDGIQSRADTLSTKLTGVSTTMTAVAAATAALDAATETPPAPPAP